MCEWTKSDDFQAVKRLSEDTFLIDNGVFFPDGSCRVYRLLIDINDYLDDCNSLLKEYGYSGIDEIKKTYGDDWKQILVECISEQALGTEDVHFVFKSTKEEEMVKYFNDLCESILLKKG